MSFALQSEKEVAIPRLQKKRLADPLATAFEIKTHLSSMSKSDGSKTSLYSLASPTRRLCIAHIEVLMCQPIGFALPAHRFCAASP